MSSERLYLPSDGNRIRDPEPNTRQISGNPVEEGIMGDRGIRDTTRKPTELTNLGS